MEIGDRVNSNGYAGTILELSLTGATVLYEKLGMKLHQPLTSLVLVKAKPTKEEKQAAAKAKATLEGYTVFENAAKNRKPYTSWGTPEHAKLMSYIDASITKSAQWGIYIWSAFENQDETALWLSQKMGFLSLSDVKQYIHIGKPADEKESGEVTHGRTLNLALPNSKFGELDHLDVALGLHFGHPNSGSKYAEIQIAKQSLIEGLLDQGYKPRKVNEGQSLKVSA